RGAANPDAQLLAARQVELTRNAHALREQGHLDEALRLYQDSLRCATALGDTAETAADYGNIGGVLVQLNSVTEAESALIKAIEIDSAASRLSGLAYHYYYLAMIAAKRGQFGVAAGHAAKYGSFAVSEDERQEAVQLRQEFLKRARG